MTRRTCRFCGAKAPVTYEGSASAPGEPPIAVYDEHGGCEGEYEPVDPPVELAAPVLPAAPAPAVPPPKPPKRKPYTRPRPGLTLHGLKARILDVLGDAPTMAVIAARTEEPRSLVRSALRQLEDAGQIQGYRREGYAIRYTLPMHPRCPSNGQLALQLWPHLLAGVDTRTELSEAVGVSVPQVQQAMTRLAKLGPDGRYRLTERAA